MTAKGFTAQDSFAPDRLYAGPYTRTERKVTLISGENVVRGEVLGRITTGGKYNASLSAAGDGSEVPRAIAAEDADASAADVDVLIFESGDFNEDEITIGTAHTVASIRDGLRDLNIYLHKTQAAAT